MYSSELVPFVFFNMTVVTKVSIYYCIVFVVSSCIYFLTFWLLYLSQTSNKPPISTLNFRFKLIINSETQ